MDADKIKQFQDLTHIGRILLSNKVFPRLEAFSGNALYCDRGIPTMNKYKTVKEVCELTGLTRKHLYYFHHEKVVQAVAYANYSVEGNDGYKLYDDAAVEKLQQIALYYQLGLKRHEIRDLMLSSDYDSNSALETILANKQAHKRTLDRHIAAIKYLRLVSEKGKPLAPLKRIPLEELGETILTLQSTAHSKNQLQSLNKINWDIFINEFTHLIEEYQKLDIAELHEQAGDRIIEQVLAVSIKHLGADGTPFVLGFFASATEFHSLAQDLHIQLTLEQILSAIQYFNNHPELSSTVTL